jgi:GNAT superfamily N-acetyltransferase
MEISTSCQDIVVVAADHPSLDRDIDAFLESLSHERRYFGPSASAGPKPFPSLVRTLSCRSGVRLAAIECGRTIGLTRIDDVGNLSIAVVADRRGSGVGGLLVRAAVEHAMARGYRRVVLRSTRRNRAARRLADQLGCIAVFGRHGRVDLIIDTERSLTDTA